MGIDPREREEAERMMKEQDERNREGRRRDLFRYYMLQLLFQLLVWKFLAVKL